MCGLLVVLESVSELLSVWQVVLKVQASGMQLCLMVLSAEDYELAVSEGMDLMVLARVHRGEDCARPRLCHISREPGFGLGLSIIPIEGSLFYLRYRKNEE